MMHRVKNEDGNVSFGMVLGLGMLLVLYTVNENKTTQILQSQVLQENISALARDTNESALLKTKSLLIAASGGVPAVKINAGGFEKISGNGFEVSGGVLNLETPYVQPKELKNFDSLHSGMIEAKLKTLMKVENMVTDASGQPTAAIVSASTTINQGDVKKTLKTKAYFNLLAFNAPIPPLPPTPAPAPNPALPASSPVPTPPATAVASASSAPVGCNSSNAPPISVGSNGIGFGVSNGGIGFGSCGGIGVNAPPGFIGFCAPNGGSCFGIGTNGIVL